MPRQSRRLSEVQARLPSATGGEGARRDEATRDSSWGDRYGFIGAKEKGSKKAKQGVLLA